MARPGIDYETVKHTAIKLLSQGAAPSVQKIRETLGTGSNTTIAQHLNVWREKHKSKEIHHLPANMPKELISAIEVLWQTAMEQAEYQLTSIKQDLDNRQTQLQQERLALEVRVTELKAMLSEAEQKLEGKDKIAHALQTELVITQEKLSHVTEELTAIKNQYELRLKHSADEKYAAIEKCDSLQKEMSQLQQQLSNQSEKYQSSLREERVLQEHSELRWLNLIDKARCGFLHL